MDKKYWNTLAGTYESEVFDVLGHDRRHLIQDQMDEFGSPEKSVSDLGCGIGRFLPMLSERFGRVYAVDISRGCLDRAREACRELDNVVYISKDMSTPAGDVPKVDVTLCVNSLMMPSLAKRLAFIQNVSDQLRVGGRLILVVPSFESSLLADHRLVEWHLRDGLEPREALRAAHELVKMPAANRLRQGVLNTGGTATKHYLQEEMVVMLRLHGLHVRRILKLEYPWSTEFESPPSWMQAPFPWDWLVIAEKGKRRKSET
jgi:SAM-dependent methyltransferase